MPPSEGSIDRTWGTEFSPIALTYAFKVTNSCVSIHEAILPRENSVAAITPRSPILSTWPPNTPAAGRP